MLFSAGKTNRLGKVDDGSSTMDFEPEEIKRNITIGAAFNHYTWKKHEVFMADTPDFFGKEYSEYMKHTKMFIPKVF